MGLQNGNYRSSLPELILGIVVRLRDLINFYPLFKSSESQAFLWVQRWYKLTCLNLLNMRRKTWWKYLRQNIAKTKILLLLYPKKAGKSISDFLTFLFKNKLMTSAYNKWCQHFFHLQHTLNRLFNNCIKLYGY